jgi:hypothetical protein
MIVKCRQCKIYFDDEFRIIHCPHMAFPANDGHNNFRYHHDSYLSMLPPSKNLPVSESTDPKPRFPPEFGEVAGHSGWFYITEDDLKWFIPDTIARTIHVAAHNCLGNCPSLAYPVWASEQFSPDPSR